MTKDTLRRQAKALRANLPMDTISRCIRDKIVASPWFKEAQTLAIYVPKPGEVDLWPLVTTHSEKTWYIPRIGKTDKEETEEREEDNLYFHQYCPGDLLQTHAFGILEPLPSAAALSLSDGSLSGFFLPALMADVKGRRLGYGKGYYDRFLSACDTTLLGKKMVTIPDALLAQELPSDPWDVSVDCIVTESRIVQCTL